MHLKNLRLNCIGPTSNQGSDWFGKCPGKIILDLDTACLFRYKQHATTLWLLPRCAACCFRLRFMTLLRRWGVECESEHKQLLCRQNGCKEPSFHNSPRCAKHIPNYMMACEKEYIAVSTRSLRTVFDSITSQDWHYSANYKIVRQRMSEISTGERPGSTLVVLDDEFSRSKRRLFEFAMIERLSGRTLINAAVKHEDGMKSQPLYPYPQNERIEYLKEASISRRTRRTEIDGMDVHSIAHKLRNIPINKDTTILVWHTGFFDLTLLREFLESARYNDILPTDDHCIPTVNVVRPNFSAHRINGRSFPLKLDMLFPIMFPLHPLVGQNHHALVDCQQTRLVCQAFDELCKPVGERCAEWIPSLIAPYSRQSLTSWAKPIPANEKGESISSTDATSSDWTYRKIYTKGLFGERA